MQNNFVEIIEKNGNKYLVKRFQNETRFLCSLKYHDEFTKKEFDLPEIVSVNRKNKSITYQFIESTINEISEKNILKIIHILSEIYHQFSPNMNIQTVSQKYCQTTAKNTFDFCKENKLELDEGNFIKWITSLKDNFKATLFKDAKPENWIFNNQIWMIDFDYVKNSYLLADFAQFLTYLKVRRTLNEDYYLNVFLDGTIGPSRDYQKWKTYYKIAQLNSNISKLIHNQSIDQSKKKYFYELSKEIVFDLNQTIWK